MITQYKKGDLENLIAGNHELYNTFSLIADKLRTIYIALGWTHMTDDFSKSDNIVEELTNDVWESLKKNLEGSPQFSTAGLSVAGWFDEEGMLNLDYSFYLI